MFKLTPETPLLTNVQDNSLVSMQTSHFQSQTKTCAPTKCQQHHICWRVKSQNQTRHSKRVQEISYNDQTSLS